MAEPLRLKYTGGSTAAATAEPPAAAPPCPASVPDGLSGALHATTKRASSRTGPAVVMRLMVILLSQDVAAPYLVPRIAFPGNTPSTTSPSRTTSRPSTITWTIPAEGSSPSE